MNSKICFIRKYTHWRCIKMFQILEYNCLRIPFRQIKAKAAEKRKQKLEILKSQEPRPKRTTIEVIVAKEIQKRRFLALDVQFPKEYANKAQFQKKVKSETIIDLFAVTKKKKFSSITNGITPIQAQRRTSLINTKNYLMQPIECSKNATESRLVQEIRIIKQQSTINLIQKVEILENESLNDYLQIIDEVRCQKLLMNKHIQKQITDAQPIKRRRNILPIYLICIFICISTCLRWL